ncbi:unnamed protein product [Aphanomyces euteiches]|nr:hypothetical protein AeRB84_004485 [Aphanomyces euteiches]
MATFRATHREIWIASVQSQPEDDWGHVFELGTNFSRQLSTLCKAEVSHSLHGRLDAIYSFLYFAPTTTTMMYFSRHALENAAVAGAKSQAEHPVVTGQWTPLEHKRFLAALEIYPRGPWKLIAKHVGTRTARQAQTHAQKYREKMFRQARGLKKIHKKRSAVVAVQEGKKIVATDMATVEDSMDYLVDLVMKEEQWPATANNQQLQPPPNLSVFEL